MKKILILILGIIVSINLLAQSPFYGDRTFISLDGQDTLKLIYSTDSINWTSNQNLYFKINEVLGLVITEDSVYADSIIVANSGIKFPDGTTQITAGGGGGGSISGNDGEIIISAGSGNTKTNERLTYDTTDNAFTAGYRTGTTGENSVVLGGSFGAGNEASGNCSTAFGYSSTASGESSTAFGSGTTASNDYSTAFGNNTTASGFYSTAFGNGTTASNHYSTAFGYFTMASGRYSTAFGSGTTASNDYSTAFGNNTTASGRYSTAFGYNTTAYDFAETALGQYNIIGTGNQTSWVTTDNLFTIGNGTDDSNRSNAFQIKKNGNATINGSLEVNTTTGAFIVPRMTTTERTALTGINGMIVYDTDLDAFYFYENDAWVTK